MSQFRIVYFTYVLIYMLTLIQVSQACSKSQACDTCDHCKCTMSQRKDNKGCCGDVLMVSRDEWKARPTKSSDPLPVPVEFVFVHHTADTGMNLTTDAEKVRAIQDFHMDVRGWDDIGYSFLVGADGRVYEGRGWNRVGAHTYGYNSRGIGISVIGNFMTKLPNPAQIRALHDIISCGEDNGTFREDYLLYGHRDARDTSCPGDVFYDEITTWERFGHTPLPKL